MAYYGPQEDSTTIFYERTFLAGIFVQGVGYGAQLVLYIMCVRYLWRERKSRGGAMLFLIAYITLLLVLLSLWVAVATWTAEDMYINNRNFPGGPWAYFMSTQYLPENVIFIISLFALTFLSDFLVLWRCWVIWTSFESRLVAYMVVSFPVLVQVASFVVGTIWCLQSSLPGHSPYSQTSINLGISFYATSISVNVVVTILITLRLYLHRRVLLDTLPPVHAKQYLSIATILVESAALYSISALAFIISYALNNPINQIFLTLSPPCQQIAGYLIILRVVRGQAWNSRAEDVATQLKPLECSANASSTNITSQVDRLDVKTRGYVSDISLPK